MIYDLLLKRTFLTKKCVLSSSMDIKAYDMPAQDTNL